MPAYFEFMGTFTVFRLLVIPFWSWIVDQSATGPEPVRVEGQTMGTTYHVVYFDPRNRNFKVSIDSLFVLVNRSISTYDGSSQVSAFNRSRRGIALTSSYLYGSVQRSLAVAAASGGAFDPTVMPLVNRWGFGPARESKPPDGDEIDSLRTFVGYTKVQLQNDSLIKTDPRVQLDFGGIGQGYGVDVIAGFLRSKGVTDFLVELGGEGFAAGRNLQTMQSWKVGIIDPRSTRENQFFKAYATVENRAFTTAGNYFNYRVIDGKKIGHTIDPRTGYPVQHELLSVSVFADDCATADAWDTAFLVAGLEKSISLIRSNPHLDALFIFTTPKGDMDIYITPRLKKYIVIDR